MRAGDPFGDHGQRAVVLALIFEPVLANEDGKGVSAPVPDQSRAGLQHDTGIAGSAGFARSCGQVLQTAPQRCPGAAFGSLLQLMRKGSDHQIAAETRRWSGAMQLPPGKPEGLASIRPRRSRARSRPEPRSAASRRSAAKRIWSRGVPRRRRPAPLRPHHSILFSPDRRPPRLLRRHPRRSFGACPAAAAVAAVALCTRSPSASPASVTRASRFLPLSEDASFIILLVRHPSCWRIITSAATAGISPWRT